MKYLAAILTLCLLLLAGPASAQKLDDPAIRTLVEKYKKDLRGPYRDIRWFCNDGTLNMPKEPCDEEIGGVQRARYKEEVIALGESNHIFLGQILSTTSLEDFWDPSERHSRMKQYLLGNYLQGIDNGWILRKAQYYRGAIQVEDEIAWGKAFFLEILQDPELIGKKYFLLRQAVKDIPHQPEDKRTLNIRALSKVIGDEYPEFMDLRVKMHSKPDPSDLAAVRAFKAVHNEKLSEDLKTKFNELIRDMEIAYRPVDLGTLSRQLKMLPKGSDLVKEIDKFIEKNKALPPGPDKLTAEAEIMWKVRTEMVQMDSSRARLALLDLSLSLEEIMFREVQAFQPQNLEEVLEVSYALSLAAAAAGFLEIWEWEAIAEDYKLSRWANPSLGNLLQYQERVRGVVEWGSGMTRAVFQDVVNLYAGFEPLVLGFYDDRIRSSVLLPLGRMAGMLGDFLAREASFSNQVFDLSGQSAIRGLNPGYARGELVVVSKESGDLEVSPDKIYLFERPPSDLKPVAGILSLSEGNLVSHVQLLARNLGIPNAVISPQNFEDLKAYSGREVFYAVSPKGTVIMKPLYQMSEEEQALFAVKLRNAQKVRVPVDKIDLGQKRVLNLREVNADDSGKRCGPKAANLGQLKLMFPDKVVEGLVIPFGIFRQHLDQQMPGRAHTYWEYLNGIFFRAQQMEAAGKEEKEVEAFVLSELEVFREAIRSMPLLPGFLQDLEIGFNEAFREDMGYVPVFLRSDTNMEDLKEFTGAGLNLTLFNVVDPPRILQGIRDVWASPYTDRSYKWRQKFLLNPENVYPSILIIPSVSVAYSGVLITSGIATGEPGDLTVAFSRGVGGAVEGQAAESYLLSENGANRLLAPAREPSYRVLPPTGGTETRFTSFEMPILSPRNLADLRDFAAEVRQRMPVQTGMQGPYDIELGFLDDHIWLFQIRPFVENKNAQSSRYLQAITPPIPSSKVIRLNTALE